MATRTLYPTIAPSLDLNFAGSKTLDPRITFSRASAATYYDGKTVAKAEENLLTYSQDFDNGVWYKSISTVVANATTSPDGSITADKLVSGVTNGYQFISQSSASASIAEGNVATISVYAKSGEYSKLHIANQSSGNITARFDLATGTVIFSSGANLVSTSITSVGNGWYRCVVVFNKIGSVLLTISGYPDSATLSSYAPTYTGDGTSGIYIWGAQLEQRSQVTAYTPTTTQPITNYIPVLQTALAGVPRFDHNPVTGESLGLLVEEQRTNLLTYSSAFTGPSWGYSMTQQVNTAISPSGLQDATKIIPTTLVNIQNLTSSKNIASNTPLSFSLYIKAAGFSNIVLYLTNLANSRCGAYFDLSAATVSTNTNINTAGITPTCKIYSVGNGWYRCEVNVLDSSFNDGTITAVVRYTAGSASYTSVAGDGYSGLYIWGAQLEAGAFPTSYIKTEASQVTRASDSASMTGANFSSWSRQDEGTFIYKNRPIGFSPTDRYHFIVSETSSILPNSISSRIYNASGNAAVYLGSNPQSVFSYSGIVVGKENSIALAYKTNDFAFSTRGSTAVTVTSGVVPNTLSRFDLLGNGCQHMARITYYPKRLTDAQLQALTA